MIKISNKARATLLVSSLGMFGSGTAMAGPLAQAAANSLKAWWENEYLNATPAAETPLWTVNLRTRAKPDECYDGTPSPFAASSNGISPDLSVLDADTGLPGGGFGFEDTCNSSKPKFNENYVWGEVRTSNDVWFGTMANTQCVITGGTKIIVPTSPAPVPPGRLNPLCEFDQSWNAANMGPGFQYIADWRVPHIRVWRNGTGELIEPAIPAGADMDRLEDTLGIRFAGKFGNRVILGGPTIAGSVGQAGINLFIFDSTNRQFLKSCNLPQYNDVRRGVTVQRNGTDNQFYFTVRTAPVNGGGGGKGAVVRWNPTASNLCQFSQVGNLDNMGGEILQFGNQLVVGTWINFSRSQGSQSFQLPAAAGLYVSPTLPTGGLSSFNQNGWKKAWTITTNWEPDYVAGLSETLGAIAVYQNWLYFGLMMQPNIVEIVAGQLHSTGLYNFDADNDGAYDQSDMLAVRRGASRPAALFRAQGLGLRTQKVEVLYGNRYLPVYNRRSRTYTAPPAGGDTAHSNKMNAPSKWGKAGFDCLGTFYMWSATVSANTLFFGTASSANAFQFTNSNPGDSAWADFNEANCQEGGDLMRFDNASSAAKAESRTGLGNPNNNFRNMQPGTSGPIVGTANASNVLFDPADPPGGWELIELTKP